MSLSGGGKSEYQGRLRRLVGPVVAVLAGAAVHAVAADAEAGPGFVEGRMCVRPLAGGDQAGNCGPVEIALLSGNRAVVRISDIVYRLQLHANEVEIVLMHGTMQIDEFIAAYDWQGKTLHFRDPDKGLRYEIDFEPRPPAGAAR